MASLRPVASWRERPFPERGLREAVERLEEPDLTDFRLLPLEREDPLLVEREDPLLVLRCGT